jgi:glucose-6-phosphate 1-dehydrogenase
MEGRGKYYHSAGALRDMVQNHMLQVLALVGMEPPISMAPDAVRDEKVKLLRAVRQISPEDAHLFSARGQYSRGWVSGAEVCGYREEPGIPPDSETETFVALKLLVDNWRWAGVPFYLRTGKRLPKRVTEVVVQFKAAPLLLFRGIQSEMTANELTIRIQPSEGISLRMSAKTPGQRVRIQPVRMDFQYGLSFGKEPPEAYERLLLDAFLGDHTLFTRGDEVEAAWSIVSPFLEGWRQSAPLNPNYEAGTWGPQAADEFLARDGRTWHRP